MKHFRVLNWNALVCHIFTTDADRAKKHGLDEFVIQDPCSFNHAELFKLLQMMTLDYRLNDTYTCLVSALQSLHFNLLITRCKFFSILPVCRVLDCLDQCIDTYFSKTITVEGQFFNFFFINYFFLIINSASLISCPRNGVEIKKMEHPFVSFLLPQPWFNMFAN